MTTEANHDVIDAAIDRVCAIHAALNTLVAAGYLSDVEEVPRLRAALEKRVRAGHLRLAGLSAVQQEVLCFIAEEQLTLGISPTYREIAAHFGWASTNAVAEHIERLVEKGSLRLADRGSRKFEVVRVRRKVEAVAVNPASREVEEVPADTEEVA